MKNSRDLDMPKKKLQPDDIRLIRACYKEKKRVEREFSREGLARKFGVARSTIDAIVDKQAWRSVA